MKNNSELHETKLQSTSVIMSVVIPAFNEGANIPIVVEETIRVLDQQYANDQYELLLVDDGSTDGTGQICDNLAQKYGMIRVFQHSVNQGVGAALKTGFINVRGKFVSFIPGDGEVTVDQVVKLFQEIGDADIIVSARQEDSNEHEKKIRTFYRESLTSGLRYILMMIFGFDPSGKEGIFVIRNAILHKLRLTSKTGLLTMEILMQCYRNGCSVKESTINIHPRISGQSKVTTLSNYLKYLWEIAKLRFKM